MQEKKIREYLEFTKNPPSLIKRGVKYTELDVQFLVKMYDEYGKSKVSCIFERNSDNIAPFLVTHLCPSCQHLQIRPISKTKFESLLQNKGEKICPTCISIQNEQAIKEQSKKIVNQEAKKEAYIKQYIKQYLAIDRSWKDGIKQYERFKIINSPVSSEPEVIKYIKEMNYQDFLQTLYWKTIAQQVRYKANFRCQLCNAENGIYVHHSTYDIHGAESSNLDKLLTLCSDCHKTFHEEREVN